MSIYRVRLFCACVALLGVWTLSCASIVYRLAPEKMRILRWIDGDTFEGECESGDGLSWREHVRIWGVDTPERGQPGYAEALEASRKTWPLGTIVHLTYPERHPDGTTRWRDNFGRLLAKLKKEGTPRS